MQGLMQIRRQMQHPAERDCPGFRRCAMATSGGEAVRQYLFCVWMAHRKMLNRNSAVILWPNNWIPDRVRIKIEFCHRLRFSWLTRSRLSHQIGPHGGSEKGPFVTINFRWRL